MLEGDLLSEFLADVGGGKRGGAVAVILEGGLQVLGWVSGAKSTGAPPMRSVLCSSAAGCVPGGRGLSSCRPLVARQTVSNE
jgi:hypothetical protein